MASSTQALVSVAMLKVALDQEGKDHIDQLNLFVRAALPAAGEIVDVAQLKKNILQNYGLRVPVEVLDRALRRLAKKRLITRDNAVYIVSAAENDGEFSHRRARASEEIGRVVQSFKAFHQKSFGAEIEDGDAQNALISFVSKNAIECLRSYVYRTPFPKIHHDTQQSYAVARFVNDAHESHPELFQLVLVVFKGVMLANAFTCPDLDSAAKNFGGVSFFLDTPLVLSLLGLHGASDQARLKELVGLLSALKGKIRVFDHTLDETDAVLGWCESAVQRGGHHASRVIAALLAEGKGQSDIVLMRGTAKERLQDLGVLVEATPPYVERLQIDEQVLQGILVAEIDYPRERAVQYDINSVRSIYALRDGLAPKRIEDSRAVFITSNSSFARAAFGYSRRYEVTKEVSPVITDYSIANIAWLKSPLRAIELPRHELLAMCFAALEPKSSVWSKFLAAAEALHKGGSITADDLAILRADGHAKQDAMDLTIGSDEDFQSDDVKQVVERVKRRLVADRDIEIQGKQAVIDEYRRELDAVSSRQALLIEELREKSQTVQRRTRRVVTYVLKSIWALMSVLSFFLMWLTKDNGWLFWLCVVAAAIVSLGPIFIGFLPADPISRAVNAWVDFRWRSWLREAVPTSLISEFEKP